MVPRSRVPAGEFKGAGGEGEVDGDADDLGDRIGGGASLEEIFIPVADVPILGGGGGDAGEGEGGSEDVFAEAGVGVLGVEGVDQEG